MVDCWIIGIFAVVSLGCYRHTIFWLYKFQHHFCTHAHIGPPIWLWFGSCNDMNYDANKRQHDNSKYYMYHLLIWFPQYGQYSYPKSSASPSRYNTTLYSAAQLSQKLIGVSSSNDSSMTTFFLSCYAFCVSRTMWASSLDHRHVQCHRDKLGLPWNWNISHRPSESLV